MMAYLMCEHFLHSDAPILSRSYMRLWAEDLGVAATCPNIEEMLLGPWSLKDSFAKLRGELQSCSSSQILVPVKRHAFSKVIDIHRFIGFAVARSQLSFIDREEDFAAAPGPMAGSRENRIQYKTYLKMFDLLQKYSYILKFEQGLSDIQWLPQSWNMICRERHDSMWFIWTFEQSAF